MTAPFSASLADGGVTASHRRAFDEDGYFVVPGAVGGDDLALLRREADAAIAAEDERIRRGEASRVPVTIAGDRYVISGRARESAALSSFLRSPCLSAIGHTVFGEGAHLFSETFVVKMANNQHGWPWHQDFGYLDAMGCGHYPPNLSVWIAIDEMTRDNGTLRVLPFPQAGTRQVVRHKLGGSWDASDVLPIDLRHERGRLLPLPAGSAVALSGALFHASDPNRSSAVRRAYLVQISPQPVLIDGRPVELAIPLAPSAR
jgi:ectoine hydroxylase-related dioxygenase (phytanoyl-CoA dioxygenase family)